MRSFKHLALITAVGITINTYGQGVLIWNIGNSGGPNATSGGLIYTNNVAGTSLGIFDGFNFNLGIEVFGGPDAGSLTSMGTFTPVNDTKGFTGFDYGKFQCDPV